MHPNRHMAGGAQEPATRTAISRALQLQQAQITTKSNAVLLSGPSTSPSKSRKSDFAFTCAFGTPLPSRHPIGNRQGIYRAIELKKAGSTKVHDPVPPSLGAAFPMHTPGPHPACQAATAALPPLHTRRPRTEESKGVRPPPPPRPPLPGRPGSRRRG
jgi:hypothetical protein